MNKIKEALQFYLDNELDEIIAEKPQNRFLESERKINFTQKNEIKTDAKPENKKEDKVEKEIEKIIPLPIKPNIANLSTSDAISALAKKFQQTVNSPNNEQKFLSLNEIIASARKQAQEAKNLAELRKAVENFDGCNLKKMATNTVFCDGDEKAKIMVIGEAPGNHEDLQGIPFCGDSGKLLDDMLRSINLFRSPKNKDEKGFYITNVMFWRPPGNRRPTDEELAICKPFVERHIQLVNPEILVLVGATSMSAVLGINDPVSKIRGQFIDFSPSFLSKPIKSFTIFHPSYLMRQPMKKKVAWQDMIALDRFLNNLKS